MLRVDPEERPTDQEWTQIPEFERKLYARVEHTASVRRLTDGPNYHWFGYYDKFETDPTDRYVLSMQVSFDGRSVKKGDEIAVGMVDRAEGNRWIPLDSTRAWAWQQGCMLQWLPGSETRIIYNAWTGTTLGARILDVDSRRRAELPRPIYHVDPTGNTALCLDFWRIQALRPGYGYTGSHLDPVADTVPDANGIWLMDLDSGRSNLLVSISRAVELAEGGPLDLDEVHYVNHAQWNPAGDRFVFLQRWRSISGKFTGFRTRMFTAARDGSDLRLICREGQISHFVWKDNRTLNVWIDDGFYLVRDEAGAGRELQWSATNGHQSYLSNTEWLVADTYADHERFQNLFLYHQPSGELRRLGRFYLPPSFVGEWRCDLHPRLSRDQTHLFVDSAHEGIGRQVYEIELPEI